MTATARVGPRRPHARGLFATPLLPPAWARLLGFAPLAAFCAVMWARLLEPARVPEMLAAAAVAVAVAAALLRAHGRWLAPVAVASVAAAPIVAGIAPRLVLWPGGWDELLTGVAAGLHDLPATNPPYRGPDPWIAAALLLIGTALLLAAAWLAFAPRRGGERRGPGAAVLVLGVLVAVPAIQVEARAQWVQGVVLAILVCAFVGLERVERRAAPVALAVVLAAGLLAAVAAPRLDATKPILDYEALAGSLAPDRGLQFTWNHLYTAMTWPRTGREMLRIRARTPSYWKVENLSLFDGVRWVQPRELGPTPQEAITRGLPAAWGETIHVRVRGIRTRLFVGAGTTTDIEASPRTPIRNAPGTFRTGPRPLREGHAYDATVWTPRPSRRQLRADRDVHVPGWTWQYLRMDLPVSVGGPRLRRPRGSSLYGPRTAQVAFAAYDHGATPTIDPARSGAFPAPAAGMLRDSDYAGVYRLAQRLRRGTRTPYAYVQRVLAHLAKGYTYSETPPPSRVPLASFLLTDKEGYCQQFSGAMALLLRMGGVPARVSTGFSPGTRDRDSGEFVVRDTDAHSWVEAYLAPYGWVTFDPTPPIGPARLDLGSGEAQSLYGLGAAPGSLGGSERTGDRAGIDRGGAGGGPPVALLVLGGVVALLAAGAGVVLLRRRRLGPPTADDAIAELRAALAGTGRTATPGLTLQGMLRRYRGTPAEPYLRTLQAARFGGADVRPTRAMRSAMRRELALGLGPWARLGAWRAIPPLPARRSRPRSTYPDGR